MRQRVKRATALRILLACCLLQTLVGCSGGGESSDGVKVAVPPSPTPAISADVEPDPNSSQPTLPITGPIAPQQVSVRVLALYTSSLQTQYNNVELRIEHLFAVANQALANSAVNTQLEIAALAPVEYADALSTPNLLSELTAGEHAAFSNIKKLRDDNAADLVTLFIPFQNDGYCGYAWIGGYRTNGDLSNPLEADYGYSVVAANCSDFALIHELGHNFGLAHSRREDATGGTSLWSVGHGIDQRFTTLMASETVFAGARLPLFSSPGQDCLGQPCGISHLDTAAGADAQRMLEITTPQVAAYR
jgi:hypothetical protein